jgi:hypothetical protein
MFTVHAVDGTEATAELLPEAVDILEELGQAGVIVWEGDHLMMTRRADGLWVGNDDTPR